MTHSPPSGLLDEATSLLRRHAPAAYGLAILVALARTLVDGLFNAPVAAAFRVIQGPFASTFAWSYNAFVGPAIAIVVCLLMAPLCAGYCRMLVRWLAGDSMRFTDLFYVFRRWELCWNVALAFAAAPVGVILVCRLVAFVPGTGDLFHASDQSPLGWLLNHTALGDDLIGWAVLLLSVPLAWAGPEALLAGRPWLEAIRSSVRLSFAHWPIALLYFAIVVVVTAIVSTLLSMNAWILGHLPGSLSPLTGGSQAFLAFLLGGVTVTFHTLALAATYREMLRRETPADPTA